MDDGSETLHGTGVSPGIAIGRALVLESSSVSLFRLDLDPDGAEREVARFQRAVKRAWRQLRDLRDRVRREAGEAYARVFEAQILILRDRHLHRETAALIRREQVNAEWAFHTVVGRYTQVFAHLGDRELRERGTDIEDVAVRVLAALTGSVRRHDLSELTEDVIVVSPDLSPSAAAGLNRDHVIGLAIDGGGPTSHTAIIASALDIPAVTGLHDASVRVRPGEMVILDGASGTLVRRPDEAETASWRTRRTRLAQRELDLTQLREQPAVTVEGVRISLLANIELPEEVASARRYGAEGVGLYRSEFLYMKNAPRLPNEDDQYEAYRALAESALPHAVVIRTLDLGGEKRFAGLPARRETNPVLGLRAIRLCLRHEEVFRTQLRAIFRAAAHGKVRMMLPMVSGLTELRRAKAVIRSVRDELGREDVPFDPDVPLGIMIEIPSAALVAGHLAEEVDFFSIGTNDLIQYVLAIDRGNEDVSYLYQPLHPAILALVRRVTDAAARRGLPVSVCGEIAARPQSAMMLIGLGVTELSMSPSAIPEVKQAIRAMSLRQARDVAEEALTLDSAEAIDDLVTRRFASAPVAGSGRREAGA